MQSRLSRLRPKVTRKFGDSLGGVRLAGIGLALVKRIVEECGGRVWIESEGPGYGCVFCFVSPTRRLTDCEVHNDGR